MTQCSDIVAVFVEYGSSLKWNSLKFEVAIDTGAARDDHDAMMSLIHYNINFLLDGNPIIITFGLGDDVSLRTVLDLPMILLLRASLNFEIAILKCPVINEYFALHMK